MTSIQWMHWKVYMGLEPFGEQRMDVRFASVCKAIWNVQIAKASKTPKFRELHEFLLRFGDAPEPVPPAPTKKLSSKELWERLTFMFRSMAKPKKDN